MSGDGGKIARDEQFWLDVGRGTAAAYASHEDWLFRRVETIEFAGANSVKRSISVDFEMPRELPDLGERAAFGTKLVPISVYNKWPPLMDFNFVGPTGHPTSLYLRTTNAQLDFGLLLGMAEKALSANDCPCSGNWLRGLARCNRDGDCRRLAPQLVRELGEVVKTRRPTQKAIERATNQLRIELKKKLAHALDHERASDSKGLITQIGATVDLAGRLAGSSILWVAATGTPGTDRIVKFSYCNSFTAARNRVRRAMIRCSWAWRAIHIDLTHAGRYVRFHLDVQAPPGNVELAHVAVGAFPPANVELADDEARLESMQALAEKYPEVVSPDEWIGPESSRFYLDYGEPLVLASSEPPRRGGKQAVGNQHDASVELVDGRAHVYLGPSSAPSHRVWLSLRLAAPREGFVKSCAIAAVAVALLMIAGYFGLSSSADHLEAAAVLLSIVPLVLGLILVRPGEQALERYHITGVRLMALLSGMAPIVGALALVLTHVHEKHAKGDKQVPPDLSLVKPIWLGLMSLSVVLAIALIVSWARAVPAEVYGGRVEVEDLAE